MTTEQISRIKSMIADDKNLTWDLSPNDKAAIGAAMIDIHRMRGALGMVLVFHSGHHWDSQETCKWVNSQVEAGIEFPTAEASTKILCDAIRRVLGAYQ